VWKPAAVTTLDDGLAGTGAELNGTERAVLGDVTAADVLAGFSAHTRAVLGQPIRAVRFRAGRIDAVWAVTLVDGRDVVVKAHRPPVDVRAVGAAVRAQELLRAAGFPCPQPLSGPDEVDGRVLTVETLLQAGSAPDGRAPGTRRLLAAGLATHVRVLRADPTLAERAGAGPAWCRYQDGPWPVPHDTIVDFRTCPPGYAWLDEFARKAAEQVRTHGAGHEVVVGHADWYAGNVAVADSRIVGTWDWELVAGAEAVVAGLAAAAFAASATAAGGSSSPEEAVAFLRDYEGARGRAFSETERRAAAGAVSWVLAFNARFELALLGGVADGSTTALVRARAADLLALDWPGGGA